MSTRAVGMGQAPLARADSLDRVLLLEGEVVGGGPDSALLPSVAMQPATGVLKPGVEDVERGTGALQVPFQGTGEVADGHDTVEAVQRRFDHAIVVVWCRGLVGASVK